MQFIDLKAQYRGIEGDVNARIRRVFEHGQYIRGPELAELEARLAEYVVSKHCIGVSSGTDALLVALMALGLGPGDEVITTPFSFIATAETIALLGARPVFVDIDPATYNIDPGLIEAAITPQTRALLPVSLYGQCADYDAIDAIAARHGLSVIEDGAQSFGATYHGRRSCGLTTIGCTSFFPSKPLGCYGDGGACFTEDDHLARRMRELTNHGQDRRYHHPRLGINGRLDTLQAAVLLAKLEVFPQELEARRRIGQRYTVLLNRGTGRSADSAALARTPCIADGNTSVYAQYTIQVEDRTRVQEALKEAGIPTAVHYPVTLDRQPALAGLGLVEGRLPYAAAAATRVLSLPMHPYLAVEDQHRIVAAVAAAVA